MMKKNVLIIHYNTPYLTECLVRSINLFVENAVIYIFDNSDESPFTAEFKNVTVLDNTKGQIIDFDKWLEKYPRRKLSGGKTNKWGSAKHCYSVEKCMELIGESFVLLDSDVLLKRDISPLFNEEIMYAGEVGKQVGGVNRLLPFLCYINVPMCKEKGVHYFDDNYMHGLNKGGKSDRYDTGAGFLLAASKYPHQDILYEDYAIHYGNGSWVKPGSNHSLSADDWADENKKLWKGLRKNNKVVYTCITGNYDKLLEPKFVSEGFDYICFTDNTSLRSTIWDIRPLPKETDGLSNVKKQRFVKINPHLLLKDYDISIWVDGNIVLKGDLNKFALSTLQNDCSVYVPKHPSRNCIYREGIVVVRMGKDKADIVNPQLKRYEEEGFPRNYGLLQSNILLRKHNNEDCIRLMEEWFKELKDGSHRDQLSFNYASWKNKDVVVKYMDKNICKSEYFFWNAVHTRYVPQDIEPNKPRQTNAIKELKNKFYEIVENKRIETHSVSLYD